MMSFNSSKNELINVQCLKIDVLFSLKTYKHTAVELYRVNMKYSSNLTEVKMKRKVLQLYKYGERRHICSSKVVRYYAKGRGCFLIWVSEHWWIMGNFISE